MVTEDLRPASQVTVGFSPKVGSWSVWDAAKGGVGGESGKPCTLELEEGLNSVLSDTLPWVFAHFASPTSASIFLSVKWGCNICLTVFEGIT